jgi:hypothetical protein
VELHPIDVSLNRLARERVHGRIGPDRQQAAEKLGEVTESEKCVICKYSAGLAPTLSLRRGPANAPTTIAMASAPPTASPTGRRVRAIQAACDASSPRAAAEDRPPSRASTGNARQSVRPWPSRQSQRHPRAAPIRGLAHRRSCLSTIPAAGARARRCRCEGRLALLPAVPATHTRECR